MRAFTARQRDKKNSDALSRTAIVSIKNFLRSKQISGLTIALRFLSCPLDYYNKNGSRVRSLVRKKERTEFRTREPY